MRKIVNKKFTAFGNINGDRRSKNCKNSSKSKKR